MNKKRALSSEEVREVLSLTRKDITATLLKDYFAASLDSEARFNTYDTFTLPIGKLFNKETIETTIGRYIINMFCYPEAFLKKYGYVNKTLDKKTIEDIDKKIADMLLYDEITTKEYCEHLDNTEWISMNTAYFICPTMDFDIYKPIPEVIKKRDELFLKYNDAIERGDTNASDEIEKELIDLSKKILKERGNEGYDFFESGNFNFSNNYKKSAIFGSAVRDPYTQKISILKSNYMDGIDKKESIALAGLTVLGGYSRGVQTQKGGYETKKINNATQTIVLDSEGSDCGTPYFLKITIPPELKDMFIDRYISEGGELKLLTKENINNYVGKKVMLRSPMYCKSEKICSKCAGELFYRIGIKNAGLLTSTFSGSLMNLNMKAFHDASIKYKDIDINDFIKEHWKCVLFLFKK